MKSSKQLIQLVGYGLLGFILVWFSTIAMVWWILPAVTTTPRERMQRELAVELGVNIPDYPYPYSFPSGYFYTVLKPGMSISEVHKIVTGYEKVVHCGNNNEVYYYLSAELENTERFKLVYDNENRYTRFQGEDPDSRTLWVMGCLPGLLEE